MPLEVQGHQVGLKLNFKEFGLEMNLQKSICCCYLHQNAGLNHDLQGLDQSFENVAQFIYVGTAVTNRNMIQVEIKRRMNSGNTCYHSVQNLPPSHLLFENIKMGIYKTTVLPVGLSGWETWSLTLREEY
jgi:hypothetical protein